MSYGTAPIYCGSFGLTEWTEHLLYLYLPVHLPGQPPATGAHELALPERIRFLHPIIRCAIAQASQVGRDVSQDHIYVSAKRFYATPDHPLNRPGWHTDGFGTDDLNFVWWDRWPTRFAVGGFVGISDDHIESMAEFDRQAPALEAITPLPHDRGLYMLDPFCVHTTPIIPEGGGLRSFLKISFSRHRYNLEGNSHNHLLDYEWEMFPREVVRNDPSQYGRDFYQP